MRATTIDIFTSIAYEFTLDVLVYLSGYIKKLNDRCLAPIVEFFVSLGLAELLQVRRSHSQPGRSLSAMLNEPYV